MAIHFEGTREERIARLDASRRRCDGNERRCLHAAQTAYDLHPSIKGVPIDGAELVRKQACSAHRRPFTDSEAYTVVGSRRLNNNRPAGAAHPYTRYTEAGR